MFSLYMRRNSKGNEIGFLEGVTQIQRTRDDGQLEMIPVLVLSWCSFDPRTGEVGTTHQGKQSCTFESPSDVVCIGTETTFFAKFDMYNEEEEEFVDDDAIDGEEPLEP